MVQSIADKRDVEFALHEQFEAEKLSQYEQFSEFNAKTVDLIISEARNLAVKELLPTRRAGDEKGCSLENGEVKVPEDFHRGYNLYREGEWIAMAEDPEWGGQGMPLLVAQAASDYLIGANYALNIFVGLTQGAARLIENFGTEEQKKMFLQKMYSGQWAGTMLLTEPEAGSDVGALTTTAVKNFDGTYSLSGSKIFISGGDQDITENIIHPVLARIEGAPPGTEGISLFIVPKIWVNQDGTTGEPNDIICTGLEDKMGLHGSPTCQLSLGSKGECRGLLLGEENKGMREMFLMMNEARLLVGMQGFGCATSAYLEALNYAKERRQGRHIQKARDKSAPQVPIIQHPDVRRMLMLMKSYVEGMRSLLYYMGLCNDKLGIASDEQEKEKYQGLIELLTPIAKGYVTDKSFDVCSMAVQVFGGYGYIKDYPVEQLVRDSRITMIYEGTNGIQAMDLVGRKLGQRKGQNLMELIQEVQSTIDRARQSESLQGIAQKLENTVYKLGDVAKKLGERLGAGELETGFSHAYPFMDAFGDLVLSWMLLWRAAVASEQMAKGSSKKHQAFYTGQIKSAEFFCHTVLPQTMGKLEETENFDPAAVDIPEAGFGG